MASLLLFACLVVSVYSAVHHPAGEHTETGSIHFYYDPSQHHLIAATPSTCFMVLLTREEQDHVHTTLGMEDLELKMMREWLGVLAETKIYHDTEHLPTGVHKWCATKDLFLLERNMTAIPSPTTGSFVG
ncbi:uncharacterized protein LOC128233523 [Mya arenaria]|uniref:uncharacterized protein LOC128233523 n=1 Tax=Mya arenaria TaxID=6604 RepID=UPI0022E26692|nr:uncharacterized protein LOC128233523 [Mya arenaria]